VSRRPSPRNRPRCASVLPGYRSNSAGGVSLGPPTGAARSSLQAAACVTCTRPQPAGRACAQRLRGSRVRRGGLWASPVWLCGVGATGHGRRARVTPRSAEALLLLLVELGKRTASVHGAPGAVRFFLGSSSEVDAGAAVAGQNGGRGHDGGHRAVNPLGVLVFLGQPGGWPAPTVASCPSPTPQMAAASASNCVCRWCVQQRAASPPRR
jgi:hypothetical protein